MRPHNPQLPETGETPTMQKVLIITHLFYASPRIPGLAKFLPEFGWEPIILTTPLGENPDSRFGPSDNFKDTTRVVETVGYASSYGKSRPTLKRHRKIRSILKFFYSYYREIVQYPDSEKEWKPYAIEAASRLFKTEDIDAMISSSSPATAHLIAEQLKAKHKIPWVADLRDLWTQNHNYPYSLLRRIRERRLELKTLKKADALMTVSKPLADELKTMHHKEVYTITSGYDPDKMSKGNVDLTHKFTVTYTGQIYARQDSSKLLVALKDLISHGAIDERDVEIRFYGPENELLQEQIERYGLLDSVKQNGMIPREASFERQRESQVLLLLNWEDPREKGVYTGKIFEYLAAQRPILATGGFGDDVVKELLDETRSGVYCPTPEDVKSALQRSYAEYKCAGKVKFNGDMGKISRYSYRETAAEVAGILDRLLRRS